MVKGYKHCLRENYLRFIELGGGVRMVKGYRHCLRENYLRFIELSVYKHWWV